MKLLRNSIALLAAALVLAACGTSPQTVREGELSVTFQMPAASTDTLAPMGVAIDPVTGDGAVERVEITVHDAANNLVRFNYDAATDTWTAGSGADFITITKANASTTAVFPHGATGYKYVARGYDSAAGGNLIAYEGTTTITNSPGSVVMLGLTSVLGDVVLVPRLPITKALPGMELDLMLIVGANGNSSFFTDYLQVPYEDYTVTYGALGNATIVGESNRGIRLAVADACMSDVTAKATVTGLLLTGSNLAAGDITANFAMECLTGTGTIAADLEPPTVDFAYTGGLVAGTVSDNYGVAKLQVFDGPILLASTDASEVSGGAAEINTTPGAYTYGFNVDLGAGAPAGISVVAYDTSGNMYRSGDAADPNNVFAADDGNDTTGDGSEAAPYATIAKALEQVNAGGTIWVNQAGMFNLGGTLTVSKNGVTITGYGPDPDVRPLVHGQWLIEATGVTLSCLAMNNPVGSVIWLWDGASITIDDNWITSSTTENGYRGIEHNISHIVHAVITNNVFHTLTTGVFANLGANFTIDSNTFYGNLAGIATDGGNVVITRNTFDYGLSTYSEYIGLGTTGLHIADNNFKLPFSPAFNPTGHIVDYTGQYDLAFLLAQNNFDGTPQIDEAGGNPAIIP